MTVNSSRASSSVPIEIIELLNKINDSVQEVKERLTRLEAQEHSATIKELSQAFEKEKLARINLEQKVSTLQSRYAPAVGVLAVFGAAFADKLFSIF